MSKSKTPTAAPEATDPEATSEEVVSTEVAEATSAAPEATAPEATSEEVVSTEVAEATSAAPEATAPEVPLDEDLKDIEARELADLEKMLEDPSPNISSMGFAKPNTVANNPVYVERTIDGVKKKFRIGGKHFSINGKDYTDVELAADTELVDQKIASGSGIFIEVFE